MAFFQLNQAFRISGVNECDLSVDLVGTVLIPSYIEGTSALIDAGIIAAGMLTDASGTTIATLRNTLQADIVLMFAGGGWDGGTILGQVAAIGPINTSAFAIINI